MTPAVRRIRLIAPLVALALAATLAPGAAQAATWRHEDATGDVWRNTASSDQPSPAPTLTAADVTRAVVRHRRHFVVVKLTLVDHRKGTWGAGAAIKVQGKTLYASIQPFLQPRTVLYELGGDRIACPGLAFTSSVQKDRVRFRVPTTCLGRPEKVRVGASFARYRIRESGVSYDDALTGEPLGDTPKLSPWITRG